MSTNDIKLMSHLLRRAGFGGTREEIESKSVAGYDATVEELLHPESQEDLDLALLYRLQPDWRGYAHIETNQPMWLYRMINTQRPLSEKMALFFHGLFCTGHAKVMDAPQIAREIDLFREHSLGSFRDLLLMLSRDPVMLYYLDNNMSHKDEPNENWGRELLELFAMGVGNYSEDDVRQASIAFTGWTVTNRIPIYPYGRYEWFYKYDEDDHSHENKTFLGESGDLNGQDIVDIIAKNPATAKFIATKLYQFFVSDTIDPAAIEILSKSYFENNYEIRAVLRTLFKSEFFKNSYYELVKSPAEFVAGVLKVTGNFNELKPGLHPMARSISYMGQDLYNPPTVEGWQTGKGWIDSGTLVERINFAAEQFGNIENPGVQAIVHRIQEAIIESDVESFVDSCLIQLGPLVVSPETRESLIEYAHQGGELVPDDANLPIRVTEMLQLIVSTQEFQFA